PRRNKSLGGPNPTRDRSSSPSFKSSYFFPETVPYTPSRSQRHGIGIRDNFTAREAATRVNIPPWIRRDLPELLEPGVPFHVSSSLLLSNGSGGHACDAQRVGDDRQRRPDPHRRGKHAAVHDKQVRPSEPAAVAVDDGMRRVPSEPQSTALMGHVFPRRKWPRVAGQRTGAAQNAAHRPAQRG